MKLHPVSIAAIALHLVAFNTLTAQQQSERQRSSTPEMKAFLGSWELDSSRTKIGANTLTYEQAGDSIRATTPRGAYTFKIDGADHPTAVKDETISWKQVDKNTIESTSKRNGKVQAVSTRVFSADGKTALVTTKLMGDAPSTVKATMERQAGSSGAHPLIGTWKQRPDAAQGGRITYTAIANGLHVRYDGPFAQEYDLIFDGKEHTVEAGGPSNLTARVINDRSIEEKWSRDGKLFVTSTISISPDGRELIEQHQPGDAHAEPSTYVYRRAN